MRHDPVASPQDGTPTKQVSDKTRPQNRCGSLWARIRRQDNETPALNALKALRGAPISMGRGEIPVELRPAAIRFLPLLWFLCNGMKGALLCRKFNLKINMPRLCGAKRRSATQPLSSIPFSLKREIRRLPPNWRT